MGNARSIRHFIAALASCSIATPCLAIHPVSETSATHQTLYRTIRVDGLSIFYREAGPRNAPTLLLLHGLPSSSRMFVPLLQRYTLYMQDYGGPVGFRMSLAHPERVTALIVQNAVAHNEGLGANWKVRREFWADRPAHEATLRQNLLSLESTRTRHLGTDPNTERYDPDLWMDEFRFLSQPGQADIQTELFYDYRTNVANYPTWQAWLREKQPRLLVIWGRYDPSFDISEPEAYHRDVPGAQVHLLDGGHFVLDTASDEAAGLIRRFLAEATRPR